MTASRNQQIGQLAQSHDTISHLIESGTDDVLDFRPGAGEWSIREILAHLVDDEMYVMRTRLERIIKEEVPHLVPHDEQKWYANRNTTRDGRDQLLTDFLLQRSASLGIMYMLRESDWQREGFQPEYGQFTAEKWLDYWVEHDTVHIEQIRKNLDAFQSATPR